MSGRVAGEMEKVTTELDGLLKRPGVADALGRAIDASRNFLASDEGSGEEHTVGAFDAIGEAVALMAEGTETFGEVDLRNLVMTAVLAAATDQPLAMDGVPPIRLRSLPSLKARVIWTLANDRDVAALTKQLSIGQVWVRMDRVGRAEKDLVYSLAQDQRRALGMEHRPAGAPRGRRPLSAKERIALAEYESRMSSPRVYQLLVRAGVYGDDGLAYSEASVAERNRRRVTAFRERVKLAGV